MPSGIAEKIMLLIFTTLRFYNKGDLSFILIASQPLSIREQMNAM